MRRRHTLIFSLLLLVCVTGVLGQSRVASANATIEIVNLNIPDVGFNDPTPVAPIHGNTGTTLGQQRLIAFQFAADQVANLLVSSITIKVGASLDNLGDCVLNPDFTVSVVLGGAGANTMHRDFSDPPVLGATWYPQALANALAEADLCPEDDVLCPAPNDAIAIFNSVLDDSTSFCLSPLIGLGITWYYGLTATPPSVGFPIDFVSVVYHELIHALGFFSAVDLTTGEKLLGFNDAFTQHLNDSGLGAWPDLNDAQRMASSVGENLTWSGPEVSLAYSGQKEMYAPPVLAEGSSVSHFDLTDNVPPNELMEPAYKGPLHDAGLADPLLQDLGWNLTLCTPTELTEMSCSDDIDNDCDGTIDGADLDCPQPCVVTQDPEVNCADTIDNDCNGSVDGDDANCQLVCESVCTPTEIPEVSCADSLDNDCDGLIDLSDSDCSVCTLSQKGDICTSDGNCCSGKCKGSASNKTCK